MRPNQQNKNRSRGRSNGRKNVNPLSRNYESNGPDVKVRGNAAHIAERYMQLARDAHSSGDSVMAENYYQHAEHYFRLLSAAQAQMPQPRTDQSDAGDDEANQSQPSGNYQSSDDSDDSGDDADTSVQRNTPGRRSQEDDGEGSVEIAAEAQEEKAERPRVRRPRRRKVDEPSAMEGEVAVKPKRAAKPDLTTAPQPDLGELPAFLTGAPARAAE